MVQQYSKEIYSAHEKGYQYDKKCLRRPTLYINKITDSKITNSIRTDVIFQGTLEKQNSKKEVGCHTYSIALDNK